MKLHKAILMSLVTFILLSACSNSAYNEAMELAYEAIEDKQYEQAIEHFQTAIDEKPNDEIASFQLGQTELLVEAMNQIMEGNLDEATTILNNIIENGDDEQFLHEHASEQLTIISDLKLTFSEMEESLQNIEKLIEDNKFKKAFEAITDIETIDLSHPYLQPLEDTFTTVKKTAEEKETLYEEAKQIQSLQKKIESLGKEKKYQDAIKLIDQSLEDDWSSEAKEKYSNSFKTLKDEYLAAIETEKKAKKQAQMEKDLQNIFYYYWVHESFSNDLFYFHPNYVINLVYASDTGFAAKVKSYELNDERNKIIMKMPEGNDFILDYNGDVLFTVQGKYYKKTESEAKVNNPWFSADDFKEANIAF